MSEQIKMPVRHFLCRDYLHISFYIKFLLFCLLAPDEIRVLCGKNKGDPQKIMISQRTISPLENSNESQSLPIAPISFTIISLQLRKKISPFGDFHSNENHRLLGNPHSHQLWVQYSQKKEILAYPRCGFGACLRCERAF